MQKPDAQVGTPHGGKGRKRLLPASTADEGPTSRKKFGIEVQLSTTKMSEFGGSVTAVWVNAVCLVIQLSLHH